MVPSKRNKRQIGSSPKKTKRPKPSPTAGADIRVSRQRLTQQSSHHDSTTSQPQVSHPQQRQPARGGQSPRSNQRLTVGEAACGDTHPGQDHPADDEKGLDQEHGCSKNAGGINDHHQCTPVVSSPGHGASRCCQHATHFQPVYSRLNPPQSTISTDERLVKLYGRPITSCEDVTSSGGQLLQQQSGGDKDQYQVVAVPDPAHVQHVPRGRETFQATSTESLHLPSGEHSDDGSTSTLTLTLTSTRRSTSIVNGVTTTSANPIDPSTHSSSSEHNTFRALPEARIYSQTTQTNERLQNEQVSSLRLYNQDEFPSTSSESFTSSREVKDGSESIIPPICAHVDPEPRQHRMGLPSYDNTPNNARIPSTAQGTRFNIGEEDSNEASDKFDEKSLRPRDKPYLVLQAFILQVLGRDDNSREPGQQIQDPQEHPRRESTAQLNYSPHCDIGGLLMNSKEDINHQEQASSRNAIARKKACHHCTFFKVACEWKRGNSNTCVACEEFHKTSKRTIRNLICFPWKMSEIELHRSGGLKLTTRLGTATVENVGNRIAEVGARVIGVTQAIFLKPIWCPVVKFRPRDGDETARFWTVIKDGKECRKRHDLATWCLMDVYETIIDLERYTIRYALQAMKEYVLGRNQNNSPPERLLIRKFYWLAIFYYEYLLTTSASGLTTEELVEENLLRNLIFFWFGLRTLLAPTLRPYELTTRAGNSTGSSWLDEEEVLDMEPCLDPTYPLGSKISLPRMIVAQIDSIQCFRILPKYQKRVISPLENLLVNRNPRYCFVIFITLFVLMREVSWMTSDRYRHARDNYGGANLRYTIPLYVEKLHRSCLSLLVYWNYYNHQIYPKGAQRLDYLEKNLVPLRLEQSEPIRDIGKGLKGLLHQAAELFHGGEKVFGPAPPKKAGEYNGPQREIPWDHPFYWVSQLLKTDWMGRKIYQVEKVPEKTGEENNLEL